MCLCTAVAVTHTGQAIIPTNAAPLTLNDVLVSPHLIKNLISVKKIAQENPINVEFDDFGCSVKDRRMSQVILRCNDSGDELYPVAKLVQHHALLAVTADVWHQRLGHPGPTSLAHLLRSSSITARGAPSTSCLLVS